jgi:hypothetical protein
MNERDYTSIIYPGHNLFNPQQFSLFFKLNHPFPWSPNHTYQKQYAKSKTSMDLYMHANKDKETTT